MACGYPDTSLGVVLRLSTYLGCQARVLGEDGFQALIGNPIVTALLSALVTAFVALIGYRLILGQAPTLATGIGWMVRLGVVLALVTGWPAFQTLVYRVAVDGPSEIAGVLLPAASLPVDGLEERVQQAYDTIRLGAEGQQEQVAAQAVGPQPQAGVPSAAPAQQTGPGPYGQPALPQTAAIFAVSTVGITAALRVAVGLLLALAPLAILGLLFDATLGLFAGWLRALGGAALGLVGASLVTALNLMLVEGELGNWQAIERGVTVVDQQGLTTLVLGFVPIMLAALWAAAKMAGAIRLGAGGRVAGEVPSARSGVAANHVPLFSTASPGTQTVGRDSVTQGRARTVADALAGTVLRERAAAAAAGDLGRAGPGDSVWQGRSLSDPRDGVVSTAGGGVGGRRTGLRRSGSAARRDRA